MPFKDINHIFLSDFEIYLLTRCQSALNTVTKHLKRLRHIVGLALKNEWIYKNPFDDNKLQWHKTDRGYLTQEEVETLIEYRFENPHMEKIRDTFIFCCFTGAHLQNSVFNGSRLGKEFSANVFNDLFNGKNLSETDNPSTKTQMFQPTQTNDEGSGIGGLFDLFTPETTGDEIAEQNFVRRLKKKQKRQRRI
ncbi:MAG: site-specific integrase [Prevotellaceae bacterium]|jgi:hypothetical protein|nr:site-specific integrase [Prevotellaceae bacterium]